MRALRAPGGTIISLVVLALACSCEPARPPVHLTIGVHEVVLEVPADWLHLDHGREHRFHRDLAQISLADIGPVTRQGYLREIEHARELFRRGQLEDARAHLGQLRLRPAFSSERQWRDFLQSWWVVLDSGLQHSVPPQDVETTYTAVLSQVEMLPRLALPEIVERALPGLDDGAQRAAAEQRPLLIDGRQAMRIDTWDRLSHDHRKGYLFALNEGNLLVARMELGEFSTMQPAFDALVDSLEIHPRPNGAP